MTTDIFSSQFEACQARLKSGKPLTFAQMQFVENFMADRTPKKSDDTDEFDEARGVSDLARKLGVNRQTIYWHKGRPDAPQTLSVSEWRNYLLSRGRSETVSRIGPTRARRNNSNAEIETAIHLLFDRVSEALPTLFNAAFKDIGIEASSVALDRFTFLIWQQLSVFADAELARHGIEPMFDGWPDERVEYPAEIVKVCERLT